MILHAYYIKKSTLFRYSIFLSFYNGYVYFPDCKTNSFCHFTDAKEDIEGTNIITYAIVGAAGAIVLTGAIITLVIIKTNKKPKAKDNTAEEGNNSLHKHTYSLYTLLYLLLLNIFGYFHFIGDVPLAQLCEQYEEKQMPSSVLWQGMEMNAVVNL